MSRITCVLVAVSASLQLAIGAEIMFDPAASTEVKRACERLQPKLGETPGVVQLRRLETPDDWLGEEGYSIESKENGIDVYANTDAGLANAVYTIVRTVLIEDLKSPFEKKWEVRDRPGFRWRSMMVAPYEFGAAHGYAVFSPELWTFQQWKDYIDYLRLFNMNRLGLYPMRLYDPEIAETKPNELRYEIWKQAMDYAHELGMEFTWVQTANFVPQELWWRHPELRNGHEMIWQGCSLCYSKARDVIRKTQRHTFEYFKDADHFMLMFSDGGGGCYCDQCSEDQAAVFIRMVEDVRETLDETGSDAEVIFWNWLLAGWYSHIPAQIPGYMEKFPQVKDIQKNVFERLGRDVVFEDISIEPPLFGVGVDTLKQAKQKGFDTVVTFCYFMNPEVPQCMLPRPVLKITGDVIRYSKKTGLDGLDGYRLSPSGRILNDFVFMRLLWNPDLTTEELIDEVAGYLTENADARAKVAEAVAALESYWETRDRHAEIAKATKLLDEAKAGEPSRQLEYVADTTFMLWGVHQLRRTDISDEEKDQVRERMFAETSKRYILQGFGGTQYQWEPEARKYFKALSTIWVE